jgi:hypothetical protein
MKTQESDLRRRSRAEGDGGAGHEGPNASKAKVRRIWKLFGELLDLLLVFRALNLERAAQVRCG